MPIRSLIRRSNAGDRWNLFLVDEFAAGEMMVGRAVMSLAAQDGFEDDAAAISRQRRASRRRWLVLAAAIVVAFVVTVVLSGCSAEDPAAAAYNEATALLDRGRFEDAVAAYNGAIALEPEPDTLARVYVNRGVAFRRLGRYDEAVEDATAAIALEPEPDTLAKAYANRAAAFIDLGRYDEAVEDATAAIALEPEPDTLAQAYVNRAIALQHGLQRYDEAVEDATAAIALEPEPDTLAKAYANRAMALYGLQRHDEVIADLVVITELLPAEHPSHRAAAEWLTSLGYETVAATTTATTTTTEPIAGLVLRGDGLGIVSFGDPMDNVLATLSDLFGPPVDFVDAESPFEGGEFGDRGPFACTEHWGYVCFDYVRTVWWDVGVQLVFADFTVNESADPVDDDYYLQVPPNVRGYSYFGLLGSDWATAEGLTIGSTVADIHNLYGDAVRFGMSCGEVTTHFFLVDHDIGGVLLGDDPEILAEFGYVDPDATVAIIYAGMQAIYAGMADGSC
jgi:tetratricopeptide (TPR) repeat protein